jgi:hypothetical protein
MILASYYSVLDNVPHARVYILLSIPIILRTIVLEYCQEFSHIAFAISTVTFSSLSLETASFL